MVGRKKQLQGTGSLSQRHFHHSLLLLSLVQGKNIFILSVVFLQLYIYVIQTDTCKHICIHMQWVRLTWMRWELSYRTCFPRLCAFPKILYKSIFVCLYINKNCDLFHGHARKNIYKKENSPIVVVHSRFSSLYIRTTWSAGLINLASYLPTTWI